MSALQENGLYEELQRALWDRSGKAVENLDWLCDHMHPYFFITMRVEAEAVVNLAVGLTCLSRHQRLLLADEPHKLIVARLNVPGSVYETLESLQEAFGRTVIPITLPIGEEKNFLGVIDLVAMKAFTYATDASGKFSEGPVPPSLADDATAAREKLVEMVAEADDSLMERFFEEGTLTQEELRSHGLSRY